MADTDPSSRVVQAWLRLPESRRRHATDAVVFAFHLLRDTPEVFGAAPPQPDLIVSWLLPHVHTW